MKNTNAFTALIKPFETLGYLGINTAHVYA